MKHSLPRFPFERCLLSLDWDSDSWTTAVQPGAPLSLTARLTLNVPLPEAPLSLTTWLTFNVPLPGAPLSLTARLCKQEAGPGSHWTQIAHDCSAAQPGAPLSLTARLSGLEAGASELAARVACKADEGAVREAERRLAALGRQVTHARGWRDYHQGRTCMVNTCFLYGCAQG
eukprot:scaffold192678_cov16-Tisochrysis_lutea.AAC.2